MKLHILSDLHLEFEDFTPPPAEADVVVLAGDIGGGTDGVEWAAQRFPARPVVYVPGNHEYYGHDIALVDELAAAAPDHVHVLSDGAVELGGVRFLCSTLWTDFRLHGEGDAWFARQRARRSITDFHSIRIGGRRLRPEDTVEFHERSRAWLERELGRVFDGPTVVVTHFLPAMPSIAARYANDPLNPAFASRLEPVIERYRPALWIHGHTHMPCDYELFGTRVVCNPRGYPREFEKSGFRPDLVVEVGPRKTS